MATFEPKDFAALLKKAIGSRTAIEFAKETGLSKYYISRRLTGLYKTPPRKGTLSAIAKAAQNDVTLEQLLAVCGYGHPPVKEQLLHVPTVSGKLAKASILSNINAFGFSCQMSVSSQHFPCDFEVTLNAETPLTWAFACIPSDTDPLHIEQILDRNYLALMYARLEKYTKLSFVTGSEEIFSLCDAKKPVNLRANVSAILYSPETLDIISEAQLSASDTFPLPKGQFSFGGYKE